MSDSTTTSESFNTGQFVPYLLAMVFFLLVVVVDALYIQNAIGFILTRLIRRFALPEKSMLTIGGISFAPLRCRLLLKNVRYVDENASIKVTDGYVSFRFWGNFLRDDKWTTTAPQRIDATMVGAQCKAYINGEWSKGKLIKVIRDGDAAVIQRINLDGNAATTGAEGDGGTKGRHPRRGGSGAMRTASASGPAPIVGDAPVVPEDSVFTVDAANLRLPETAGRVVVHLNGASICLHNAKSKYDELAKRKQQDSASAPTTPGLDGNKSDGGGEPSTPLQTTRGDSLYEQFMKFSRCITIEMHGSTITAGAPGREHAYAMHIGFERLQGAFFLTDEGVHAADLYRQAVDVNLFGMHVRFAHIDEGLVRQARRAEPTSERKGHEGMFAGFTRRLARGATLLVQGDHDEAEADVSDSDDDGRAQGAAEVPAFIRRYGVMIDRRHEASGRILYYWDAPGVQRADEALSIEHLPKSGLEIEIDSAELCYGSWANHSLMQTLRLFMPLTYDPYLPLEPQPGELRPVGRYEQLITFTRDCRIRLPYKKKTAAPSPPFGIVDSGEDGFIHIRASAGSKYVYKAPWIIPRGENTLVCETLFSMVDCRVTSDANGGTDLLRANRADIYMDATYGRLWNDPQEWDFVMRFRGADVFYAAEHMGMLWDVIYDWGYVRQLYHGASMASFSTKHYYRDLHVPHTQRYEIFFEPDDTSEGASSFEGEKPGLSLHLNANADHVVFNADATAPEDNSFLQIRAKHAAVHYWCPMDDFWMSSENEAKYNFEVSVTDVDVAAHVPQDHEIRERCNDPCAPFLHVDRVGLSGYLANVYFDFSVDPFDHNPLSNRSSGFTPLSNSTKLEIEVDGVTGRVHGHHVKVASDAMGNLASDDANAVTPSEFYWLASLHHAASQGKNMKYPFSVYQTLDEPRKNDTEVFTQLVVRGIAVSVAPAGEQCAIFAVTNRLELTSHTTAFASDLAVAVPELVLRFIDPDTGKATTGSHVSVNGATLSKSSLYGPAPDYVVFYASTTGNVGGVVCDVTAADVATAMRIGDAFATDQRAVHFGLVEALAGARDYPLQEGLCIVPRDVAIAFAEYLEEKSAGIDYAASHGVFCTQFDVAPSTLIVAAERTGVARSPASSLVVLLPAGVHSASSTLNDGNSTSRTSVAVERVTVRGLLAKEREMLVAEVAGDVLEVASLTTCLRYRGAQTMGGTAGVQAHAHAQQRFFDSSNTLRVMVVDFDKSPPRPLPLHRPLQAPTVLLNNPAPGISKTASASDLKRRGATPKDPNTMGAGQTPALGSTHVSVPPSPHRGSDAEDDDSTPEVIAVGGAGPPKSGATALLPPAVTAAAAGAAGEGRADTPIDAAAAVGNDDQETAGGDATTSNAFQTCFSASFAGSDGSDAGNASSTSGSSRASPAGPARTTAAAQASAAAAASAAEASGGVPPFAGGARDRRRRSSALVPLPDLDIAGLRETPPASGGGPASCSSTSSSTSDTTTGSIVHHRTNTDDGTQRSYAASDEEDCIVTRQATAFENASAAAIARQAASGGGGGVCGGDDQRTGAARLVSVNFFCLLRPFDLTRSDDRLLPDVAAYGPRHAHRRGCDLADGITRLPQVFVSATQGESPARCTTVVDHPNFPSSEATGGGPPPWAMRPVDVAAKSRDGAATSHHHVETVEPLRVFATPHALTLIGAVKLAVDAAKARLAECPREGATNGSHLSLGAAMSEDNNPLSSATTKGAGAGFGRGVSGAQPRSHRPNWNATETTISWVVPSAQVQLLDHFVHGPATVSGGVSSHHHRRHTISRIEAGDDRSVYVATVTFRNLHGVSSELIPAKVRGQTSQISRRSLGVEADAVTVGVQSVHEPRLRLHTGVSEFGTPASNVSFVDRYPLVAVLEARSVVARGKSDRKGPVHGARGRFSTVLMRVQLCDDAVAIATTLATNFGNAAGEAFTTNRPASRNPSEPTLSARDDTTAGFGADTEDAVSPLLPQTEDSPSGRPTDDDAGFFAAQEARQTFSELVGDNELGHAQGNVDIGQLWFEVLPTASSPDASDRPRTTVECARLSRVVLNDVTFGADRGTQLHGRMVTNTACSCEGVKARLYPAVSKFLNAISGSDAGSANVSGDGTAASAGGGPAVHRGGGGGGGYDSGPSDTLTFVVRDTQAALHYTPTNFSVVRADRVSGSLSAGRQEESSHGTDDRGSKHATDEQVTGKVKLALLARARRAKTKTAGVAKAPTVFPSQYLLTSAQFFVEGIALAYMADVGILVEHVDVSQLPADMATAGTGGRAATSAVGTVTIASTTVAFHLGSDKASNVPTQNLQVHVSRVGVDFPFRPTAIEVIHPQAADWARAWSAVLRQPTAPSAGAAPRRAASAPATTSAASSRYEPSMTRQSLSRNRYDEPPSPRTPHRRSNTGDGLFSPESTASAGAPGAGQQPVLSVAVDIRTVEAAIGLATKAQVRLQLPRFSAWANRNPNEDRVSVRAHLHPSVLSSRTSALEQSMPLPQAFLFANQDGTTTAATAMVDFFEAVVSPDLFSHMVLTYEQILGDIAPMFATGGGGGGDDDTSMDTSQDAGQSSDPSSLQLTVLSPGGKVSLLAQHAEFTVAFEGLKANGLRTGQRAVDWFARVNSVEAGLYDRDDFDRRHSSTDGTPSSAGGGGGAPLAGGGGGKQGDAKTPKASSRAKLAPNTELPPAAAGGSGAKLSERERQRVQAGYVWGLVSLGICVNSVDEGGAMNASAASGSGSPNPSSNADDVRLRVHSRVEAPMIIVRAGCAEHLQMLHGEFNAGIDAARSDIAADRAEIAANLKKSPRYRSLAYRAQQLRQDVVGGEGAARLEEAPPTIVVLEMSRLTAVMPAGDATYATLRAMGERTQDGVTPPASGGTHTNCRKSHTHRVHCFDRTHFAPFCAAKMSVTSATLRMLMENNPGNGGVSLNLGSSVNVASGGDPSQSPSQSAPVSSAHTGRFTLDDVRLYITDGSKMDPSGADADLRKLLPKRRLVGGLGLLSEWQPLEFTRTKNRVLISNVDVLFSRDAAKADASTRVQVQVAAPEAHVSSRMPVLAGLIMRDLDTGGAIPPPSSSQGVRSHGLGGESPSDRTASHHQRKQQHSGGVPSRPPASALEISARVLPGSVTLHSFRPQQQRASADASGSQRQGGAGGLGTTGGNKRVTFNVRRRERSVDSAAGAQSTMLQKLPLPAMLIVSNATSMQEQDGRVGHHTATKAIVQFESAVEVSPCVALLGQEHQYWQHATAREKADRAQNVVASIRAAEDYAATNNTLRPIHTSYVDAIIPVPRAMLQWAVSTNKRIRHEVRDATARGESDDTTAAFNDTAATGGTSPVGRASRGSGAPLHRPRVMTSSVFHLTLTPMRLSLTCEPASSSAATFLMDPENGQLEIIIGSSDPASQPSPAVAAALPQASLLQYQRATGRGRLPSQYVFVAAENLRVETSSRLEMKAFEAHIPSAQLLQASRGTEGVTIANVGGNGSHEGLDVIAKVANLSQALVVVEVWRAKLREAEESLTTSPSLASSRPGRRGSSLEARARARIDAVKNKHLDVFVSAAVIHTDFGPGGRHDIKLQDLMLSEAWQSRPAAAHEHCSSVLRLSASKVTMESDGQVSGTTALPSGLRLRMLHSNVQHLPAIEVHADVPAFKIQLKERQVKEVVTGDVEGIRAHASNAKAATAQLNAAGTSADDGAEDGDAKATVSDLSIARLNVGLSTDAPEIFAALVETCNTVVAEQWATAQTKAGTAPTEADVSADGSPTSASRRRSREDGGGGDDEDDQQGASSTAADQAETKKGKRPPTGELSVRITDATVTVSPQLYTGIAGDATPGIILVLPWTEITYAEIARGVGAMAGDGEESGDGFRTPAGQNEAATAFGAHEYEGCEVRRALHMRHESWEVQRATGRRTQILAGRGTNSVELASEQVLGDDQVGFVFALRQANPWHVSSNVADIDALRNTIAAFSAGSTSASAAGSSGSAPVPETDASREAQQAIDSRKFVPLAPVRFAPELRVVGDVGFNIDTLLSWLGVPSGHLVPVIMHRHVCDPLHEALVGVEAAIEALPKH